MLVLLVHLCSTALAAVTIDDMEQLFGATNVQAQVGNGGLTAGLSAQGELTVLRWPSPSYYDQVHYHTSRSEDARELPHFGARENEGVFAGLLAWRDGEVQLSWLRDLPGEQAYAAAGSPVLVNTWEGGWLRVEQRVAVAPDSDVLAWTWRLEPAGEPPDAVALVFFENLAPCLRKTERIPMADWADDDLNDHGAVYLASADAVVHFLPQAATGSFPQGREPYTEEEVDASFGAWAESAGPGIYLAIGGDRSSAGHQVGLDAEAGVAADFDWRPQDAFDDLADGLLSGSPLAAGQVDSALAFELDPGGDELSVLVAAAPAAREALDALAAARERGAAALREDAEADAASFLAGTRQPPVDDPDVAAFLDRTMLSLRQGTDRNTGAIVASIATQPPYAEDWPRDSAFFDAALDLAGQAEAVTRHELFLSRVQAREEDDGTPAGAWYMNYYADGMVGGYIPFEIDETGLALWSLWTHAAFLADPDERRTYLRQVWPVVERGAELLESCRDDSSGLQCYANEDDHPEQTRTLHGAQTAWLGLRSAVEAGTAICADPDELGGWSDRADELLDAAVSAFWDPESGRFTGDVGWWIWPTGALPGDDPRVQSHAEAIYQDARSALAGEGEGGTYVNKATVALALLWRDDEEAWSRVEDLARVLAVDLPAPTRHVGEVFVSSGDVGSPVFDNRVAVPHLWSATLTWLTWKALEEPQAFDPFRATGEDLAVCDEGGRSCGCASGGQAGPWLLGVLGLLLRRRAR